MKGWVSTGRPLLSTPLFSVSLVTRNMRPSLRVQIPLLPARRKTKNTKRRWIVKGEMV